MGRQGSAEDHQIMSSGRISGKTAAAKERGVSAQVWRDALCPLQQKGHLLIRHSNTRPDTILGCDNCDNSNERNTFNL